MSSTPSPRTRDGKRLLHEVGRASDSAAHLPKCRLCAQCDGAAKRGLIGREPRLHEGCKVVYILAYSHRKLEKIEKHGRFILRDEGRFDGFELSSNYSDTGRRRTAASSRESMRQHSTHTKVQHVSPPCRWRKDGRHRPRAALTRSLSKSACFFWARNKVQTRQDERCLDRFLSSTPSPRTRDGEKLQLEIAGMRDTTARIRKGRVCSIIKDRPLSYSVSMFDL